MLIGFDLDNTIIRYDKSLHKIALERGLIQKNVPMLKRSIRDEVRRLHGDEEWQKLQVAIYGTEIDKAELMSGVWDCLLTLKQAGHSFQIVSHKTRYPNYGQLKIDLRKCALNFLTEANFFSNDTLSMSVNDMFFLSTREEKVRKIAELGHHYFIDDLEEVFTEPLFPDNVHKILFSPEKDGHKLPGCSVFSTFEEISNFIVKRTDNGTI
ncbi:hypothetical protein [Maridesulfovibrio ferrireducens]|uniref:hypothetical protein n=1 Tax=Maridesulfovibrio ferrireducens TaxID=246191 RepID=UPI001A231DC5|nr:hypothetical protein [Maridesulfovibrio ferrireducens]MBI9109616.1 hypothetical protein [Maridesulfovibrio ferrireducens]